MLVYGDPKFSVRLSQLFDICRARVPETNLASLDELRSLLVFAGQFEQAVADAAFNSVSLRELMPAATDLTDCLARFFCRQLVWKENLAAKEVLMETLDHITAVFGSAP